MVTVSMFAYDMKIECLGLFLKTVLSVCRRSKENRRQINPDFCPKARQLKVMRAGLTPTNWKCQSKQVKV